MIRLETGSVRLTVAPEFGCRWMRLDVKAGGRWTALLVPASLSRLKRDPFFDGAYLMAPWCNRLPKARFRFQGREHQLKPNFPDGSAIHGDAWGRRWTVKRKSATSLEAALDSRAQRDFNFPWPVSLRHGIRLTTRGVTAWISVRNMGKTPCPAGVGFHPFFPRLMDGTAASIEITPRRAVSLQKRVFDEGYVLRGKDVSLDYGAAGEIRLSPGNNADHLFVWAPKRFRGEAAAFACVEPMTMKVGGFSRPGMRVLRAGETLKMAWTVTFSRTSAKRS